MDARDQVSRDRVWVGQAWVITAMVFRDVGIDVLT